MHGVTKRCKECNKIERKRIKSACNKRYLNAKKEKNPRFCLDCKICITYMDGKSRRCKTCAKIESNKKLKIRRARYRSDPEYRKMESVEASRRREIVVSTPEGRKKYNAENVRYNTRYTTSIARSKMKRHRRYKEAERIGPLPSKQEMFDRQNGICPYTGISMHGIPLNELHTDHVVPLAGGGANTSENLCVTFACVNLSKGNKYLHDWIRSPLYQRIVEPLYFRRYSLTLKIYRIISLFSKINVWYIPQINHRKKLHCKDGE